MPILTDSDVGISEMQDSDVGLTNELSDSDLGIEQPAFDDGIPAINKLGAFQPSQTSSGSQNVAPLNAENPDYDFTRAAGLPLLSAAAAVPQVINKGMDLAGKGVVAAVNLPTTISNKLKGAQPGDPDYTEPAFDADRPMVNLPDMPTEYDQTHPVLKGAYDAAKETLEGLTQPQMVFGLPLLGISGLTEPAVKAFAVQLAANIPSDIGNIADAETKKDATKAWATAAIHALMLKGTAGHAIGPETPSESTAETPPTSNAAGQLTPEPAAPSVSRFPLPIEAQSALDSVKTASEPETPPAATPKPPIESLVQGQDFLNIKQPHKVGIEAGLNLTADDVPDVKFLQEQSNNEMKEAVASGNSEAFKAAFGKSTFLGGVIEGAEKKGPNYDLYQQQLASAAKENVPAPNESINPIMGNTQSAAGDEINKGSVTTPALSPEPPLSGASSKTEPLPNSEPVKEEVAPSQNKEQPQKFGIAQRVRDVRGDETASGEGISAEDSVLRGRDLLESGVDPEKAMSDFETSGKLSADDIAVARAHGEKLAKTAKDIESSKGVTSPEYKEAFKNLSDWDARTKKMQTQWHIMGQAQQGETDVDLGTFTGLQQEFKKSTGKEFKPEQVEAAGNIAKSVKKASDAVEVAKAKVYNHVLKQPETNAQAKSITDRIMASLDKVANDALTRIKARRAEGRLMTGLDPSDLADHAIYGASKLAKGVVKFSDWSKEMVKDLGDYVKPHLKDIFEASKIKLEEAKNEGNPIPLKDVQAGKKFTPEQVKSLWQRAKAMVDSGESDFDSVRYKLAQELGIPVKEVTEALAQPKGAKRLTDEMYQKMSEHRRIVNNAKNWLDNAKYPGWLRFTRAIPRAFFKFATYGHGTVGMITHAGINIFDPIAWKNYWPNFFRQYKLMFDGGYHERMMQDLVRDPLYTKARRAGLANDPTKLQDDYAKGSAKKIAGALASGRGFDALKLFRQAQFNQAWNKLPSSLKNSEMAKLVADGVNHSTGIVRSQFPRWLEDSAGVAFFAPKLELSRWMWLAGDSAKSAYTLGNWQDSSPEARSAAMADIKQKATVVGTLATLLAINQSLLKVTSSSQNINISDPKKSDYLAFKIDGYNVGIVAPMIGVARLLKNLWDSSNSKKTGEKKPSEVVGDYIRSKLSPFLGTAYDSFSGSDYQKRPLPLSNKPVPKWMRNEGIGKYSMTEYAADKAIPIPFKEAVKEAWKYYGMDDKTAENWWRALILGISVGSSGARVVPDSNQLK